jgi:hypothetical protein
LQRKAEKENGFRQKDARSSGTNESELLLGLYVKNVTEFSGGGLTSSSHAKV